MAIALTQREAVARLLIAKRRAEGILAKMTKEEREALEKQWDIEHAYFSSVLEGSNINLHEVQEIALGLEEDN